jgi:FKBP-type peptidyl-prolyl cis-trans isomerase FkpA
MKPLLAAASFAALIALASPAAHAADAPAKGKEATKEAAKDASKESPKEAAAVTTSSGLIYQSLKEGSGPSPSASDTVKVHYRGTFLDGREFDSSYSRGQPASFPLNRVIKCWTEGVQRMKVGGKAKLTCPPAIAYGERGAGPIPANSTLLFEVELLEIGR